MLDLFSCVFTQLNSFQVQGQTEPSVNRVQNRVTPTTGCWSTAGSTQLETSLSSPGVSPEGASYICVCVCVCVCVCFLSNIFSCICLTVVFRTSCGSLSLLSGDIVSLIVRLCVFSEWENQQSRENTPGGRCPGRGGWMGHTTLDFTSKDLASSPVFWIRIWS